MFSLMGSIKTNLLISSVQLPDTFPPLQESHRLSIAFVHCSAGLGSSAPGISRSSSKIFSTLTLESLLLQRHVVMNPPAKQSQNAKRVILVTSFLRNSEVANTEKRSVEVYIHHYSPTLGWIVVLVFTKSDG